MKLKSIALVFVLCSPIVSFAQSNEELTATIRKVNDYWQQHNAAQCR